MKYLSHSFQKRLKYFLIRIVLGVVICFIYFSAWRPARVAIAEKGVYPQSKAHQTAESSFQISLKSGSIFIQYQYREAYKELQYRPGFGFYFLVALIFLLFISRQPKHYLMLAGLHLVASFLSYLGLLSGVSGTSAGFILTDFVSAYLAPALSLALVAIARKGGMETGGKEARRRQLKAIK